QDFSYVALDRATDYAAADARQTLALVPILQQALKDHSQAMLYEKLELPLINILCAMEQEGIVIDKEKLHDLNKEITVELEELESTILKLVDKEPGSINLNSPKQLEELLFDILKLPVIKKTAQKTGRSTDYEVLKELSKLHGVPSLIIKYRELFKLKTTYIEALEKYRDPTTSKIHTTFSQTATATGRLSSSDPNLQNIPPSIRHAFKASCGKLFISADYSQIELRVLAYLSQDSRLRQAFKEKQDIHALTATGLFNVSLDHVSSAQRELAKRINFSILYGLTPYGLSKDLDIPFKQAKEYIERYLAQYPGVVAWMNSIIEKAKAQGYIETLWGRRRYVPGIYEKNRSLYELARRIAINTVVQGTAAELVKLGMIKIFNGLKERVLDAKMILQIHDEIVLQSASHHVLPVVDMVKDSLTNIVDWNVPMEVTIRTGASWGEVTK
ncbi:MAG TPA: DNA polymerase, partial [Candidatus Babeliaceae bacterium]|nr:DNA polymerase [Candidatus Babeliaceae bacterium]